MLPGELCISFGSIECESAASGCCANRVGYQPAWFYPDGTIVVFNDRPWFEDLNDIKHYMQATWGHAPALLVGAGGASRER